MDRAMGDVTRALAEQHAELRGLIAGLDETRWPLPTRCDGWDVADVVLHLAQTDEMALASLEGRFSTAVAAIFADAVDELGPSPVADDIAGWAVEHERGAPSAAVAARWRTASDQLRARLSDDDSHRRVPWVTGELSVLTLAATRLAECWIHTGDVADALGVEATAGEGLRHVARLAWRTLPYAFARAGRELQGPVAFRPQGPTGARWDFEPDAEPATIIEGDGTDLCLVAARRVTPTGTGLRATGADAEAVLDLVRTYA